MTTQTITQPTAFFIDSEKKRMYYNNTDLFNYNQMFYYGCKVKPKTIVIKKNIPETEYLYANLKKGDWNLSSPECKKAQLLISKEWVDKYYFKIDVNDRRVVEETIIQEPINTVTEEPIPITTQDPTVNIVQEPEEIVEAPRLLLLDDNEKFKDVDGNIIEIETRGTKERNNIYFKVKDISFSFGMPNLNSILLHNNGAGYKINKHYKTFLIEINNNSYIKSLYLTYYGFLKVINTSRINSNFFTKNINIITKWLDYLINNKYCDNYILSNVNPDLSGVIYICSSPLIDCIKIGYWTGSITGLQSRYKMVYGKDVFLNCKNVNNVRNIEKDIHSKFKQFNISGELFQKDKLQLYIDYLNNNIVEYLDRNFKEEYDEIDEDLDDEIKSNNECDEIETVEEAPGIIHLNYNEKFRDTDGNIVEIETRGTKIYNNIYFKVTDVSKGFNMKSLSTSLLTKYRGYERNIHYKTFLITFSNREGKTTNKNIYLTYSGLLRVLFVSRNKNVERFQDWAMKTLFTIQMGKEEEKVKLGTSILNIPEKTYKAVFKKHANKFPCIYLLSLGNVGVLRKTFGIVDSSIPDDSIIYKYGFTDDLGRRMGEHEDKYGKLENVKIVLSTFHIIDPKYTCDAEGDIREECNAYEIGLQTEGYNELIVLNKKQLEHVKKNYGRIGRDYAGHTAELQEQIVKLNRDIEKLNYDTDRLKTLVETNEKFKIYEIKDKEKEIERLKTLVETNEKIKKLEIENLELQIKILTNNK
jgi:hypothetical protein